MAFTTTYAAYIKSDYLRDRTVNQTGSFPSRVATITEPVTASTETATSQDVIEVAALGTECQTARIIPIGIGADNATLSVRVLGWTRVFVIGATPLWVPTILCEYLCTLSTAVGVDGSGVLATERFADTLTLVANRGVNNQDTTVFSPTNDTPGNFIVNLRGSQKIEICYSMGTATSGNSIVQFI